MFPVVTSGSAAADSGKLRSRRRASRGVRVGIVVAGVTLFGLALVLATRFGKDSGLVRSALLGDPAYPLSTHVRAFTAHLVFGLTLAGVVEVVRAVLRRR